MLASRHHATQPPLVVLRSGTTAAAGSNKRQDLYRQVGMMSLRGETRLPGHISGCRTNLGLNSHSTHNCVIHTLISTTVSEVLFADRLFQQMLLFLETAVKVRCRLAAKLGPIRMPPWIRPNRPESALLCTQIKEYNHICLDSKWSGIANHPLPPAQKRHLTRNTSGNQAGTPCRKHTAHNITRASFSNHLPAIPFL
jgi:hypothetical protein